MWTLQRQVATKDQWLNIPTETQQKIIKSDINLCVLPDKLYQTFNENEHEKKK